MKACSIYKTNKKFKIVTVCPTNTGTYVLREPIYILPQNVDERELGNKIIDSLNSSKEVSYYEDSIGAKGILKLMKEASYRKLYLNSSSCTMYLEDNTLTIKPNICKDPNAGLEVVEQDIQRMDYSESRKTEIAYRVVKILEKKY